MMEAKDYIEMAENAAKDSLWNNPEAIQAYSAIATAKILDILVAELQNLNWELHHLRTGR